MARRHHHKEVFVCWLVGCLTSQQQASVSQGRIRSDNFTCCHTEIEAADQTFYLTQSQYTDTGPTSPRTDPIMPGAWQGSHWSTNDSTPKKSRRKRDSNLGSSALEADALTTRPTRRSQGGGKKERGDARKMTAISPSEGGAICSQSDRHLWIVRRCPTMTQPVLAAMRARVTSQSKAGSPQAPTGVTTMFCCSG